jgi:hypothetical protein
MKFLLFILITFIFTKNDFYENVDVRSVYSILNTFNTISNTNGGSRAGKYITN